MPKTDFAWVSSEDAKYIHAFQNEDVGSGLMAAFGYMKDHTEPQDLSPDAQKVYDLLKKRIVDTENGFDPYA